MPKTLDFLRELELEHCDNIWFTKQDERKKVNRIVRSKLAKKTNQEEIPTRVKLGVMFLVAEERSIIYFRLSPIPMMVD